MQVGEKRGGYENRERATAHIDQTEANAKREQIPLLEQGGMAWNAAVCVPRLLAPHVWSSDNGFRREVRRKDAMDGGLVSIAWGEGVDAAMGVGVDVGDDGERVALCCRAMRSVWRAKRGYFNQRRLPLDN